MRKSKIKKVMAAMMASMMLLGAAITANAADHEHYCVPVNRTCYNSYTAGSHPYTVTDTDGTTQIKSCDMVIYLYAANLMCIYCGVIKEGELVYTQEIHHMQCGKGVE